MGFTLKYCDVCGNRIPKADFISGAAIEWHNRTYCKEHVPDEARPPAKARTATPPLRASGVAHRVVTRDSGVRMAPSRRSTTTTRTGMAVGTATASGSRTLPRARRASRTPVWIASIGGGAAAVVLLLALFVSSAPSQPSETNVAPSAAEPNEPSPRPDPAAQRLADLEPLLRAALRSHERFLADDPEAAGFDPEAADTAFREALELRKQAKQALAETTGLHPVVELLVGDLEAVIQDFGTHAAEPYLKQVREQVQALRFDLAHDEAIELLTAAYDGRRPLQFPARFCIGLPPHKDLLTLREEVEQERQRFRPLTERQRNALRRLLPIQAVLGPVVAAEAEGVAAPAETDWNAVQRRLNELLSLGEEQPFVESEDEQSSPVGQLFHGMCRPGILAFSAYLQRRHTELYGPTADRSDTAAQRQAWLARARWFTRRIDMQDTEYIRIMQLIEKVTPTGTRTVRATPMPGLRAIVAEASAAAAAQEDFVRRVQAYLPLDTYIQFTLANQSDPNNVQLRQSGLDALQRLREVLFRELADKAQNLVTRDQQRKWWARSVVLQMMLRTGMAQSTEPAVVDANRAVGEFEFVPDRQAWLDLIGLVQQIHTETNVSQPIRHTANWSVYFGAAERLWAYAQQQRLDPEDPIAAAATEWFWISLEDVRYRVSESNTRIRRQEARIVLARIDRFLSVTAAHPRFGTESTQDELIQHRNRLFERQEDLTYGVVAE